ncbi:hypothetical protein [Streptomyces mirabilis]
MRRRAREPGALGEAVQAAAGQHLVGGPQWSVRVGAPAAVERIPYGKR